MDKSAALAGLRVVDFSNLRTGAQASQLLADFGADVVHVETPGGSPLRAEAAWPFLARGKRSLQLDLKDPGDLAVAQRLGGKADVVIETFRPGVADRLGIGYEALSRDNPGLVYASITGFGPRGPCADLQGYEGVVLAKLGALWALEGLAPRQGPAFPSAAFSCYPASQLALLGIFAALFERDRSGVGQKVQTTLAQALSVYDTFNWFSRVIASRYEAGLQQTARVVDGVPSGGISFRLLVALSKDGRWLQFSQTAERLFRSMMKMFGLEWMFDDPRWSTAPDFEDVERRVEFWETLLNIVRSKTIAEWLEEFDRNPNVWAEQFRKRSEVLDHPQMQWNRMVAEVEDPDRGRVRQPGPLVRIDGPAAARLGVAPRLGQYDAELRAQAKAPQDLRPRRTAPPAGRLPLEGVTVVELGTYYAAPFGATLLADLGARVIKLEQPDGDPYRNMLPFPEIAGIKPLLGKECVAVDLHTDKGREIAYRIIGGADIVLQSFRAGVADRLKLDAKSLRGLNPNLVYLSAPGYGEGGPCGHRPAFAPTIGAAAGWAWRNAGSIIPDGPDLTLEQVKAGSMQLSTAVLGVGNSDGLSACTAGAAMLLGLVARSRGAGAQEMLTTMLSSTAHALCEMAVEYDGCPPPPTGDAGLYGWSALYRLYEAAEEWVFLAAPSDREWKRLTGVLPTGASLAADPRFATAAARTENDAELAGALSEVFRTRTAAEWEIAMRAADVACVVAARGPLEANYLDEGSLGRLSGYVTNGRHPIFDEMPRLKALVEFSRSSTAAGDAGLVGQHTEKVLREYGYGADELAALAAEGVILFG